MQWLTKYQLLLKDLADASNVVCGKVEIVEALDELVSVVKVVNDSLQNITFKGNVLKFLPHISNDRMQ